MPKLNLILTVEVADEKTSIWIVFGALKWLFLQDNS